MIRRPLGYVLFAFAFEIFIFVYAGKYCAAALIIFVVVFSLISIIKYILDISKDGEDDEYDYKCLKTICHKALLVILACIFSFCNMCVYQDDKEENDLLIKEAKQIEGTVIQCSEKTTSFGKTYRQYKIKAKKINEIECETRIYLLIKDFSENAFSGKNNREIVPGDNISSVCQIEEIKGRRNPGCFDYARYLEASGISAVMKSSNMENLSTKKEITLSGRLYIIKNKFRDALAKNAGDDVTSLMMGIMFGEKDEIEDDIMESFRRNGTAHILAVSGLHIGMIYGFLSAVWRWKKKKLYFSLITVFFICYMILASFSPSVIRAVFMLELHMFADMAGKRYDLASAAFLTALLILTSNPMQLFHAGFQMSYLAVLTMSLMMPYIKRLHDGIFSAGISIQIGLTPYIMYNFNCFSLLSIFVNVPVIMLAGIMLPLGLTSMLAMWISSDIFSIESRILSVLCFALRELNEYTCLEDVTVFDVTSPGIFTLSIYYLTIVVFLSENGRLLFMKKKIKTIIALAVAVAMLAFSFCQLMKTGFEDTDIVFVDVGQGDCVHLKMDTGDDFLIDGGGNRNFNIGKGTLKPYLLKNGVKSVKGAFVTHLHMDHYKGIAELCREGMIKKLFIFEGNRNKEAQILEDTKLSKSQLCYIGKGDIIKLSEDSYIEVMWPEKINETNYANLDENDENDSCLIMKLVHNGKSLLVTGDVDADQHDILMNMYEEKLNIDILKVAHHGSRYSYSENFTDNSSPEIAVVQVGKNNYGHPSKEVIEKYIEKNINVYRTDINGAIGLKWGNNGVVSVITMITEKITEKRSD